MGEYEMICDNCIFFNRESGECVEQPDAVKAVEGCDPACDMFRYNYIGRKFRAHVEGIGERTLTRGVTGSFYYKKQDGRHIEVEKYPGDEHYRVASNQVL